MKNKDEVLEILQVEGYNVRDYLTTLVVHNQPETQANTLSRNDLLDALDHEINYQQLRQIDAWTIVIIF